MKKNLIFIIVLICITTGAIAQQSTFEKGDKVLNLGLGLGSTLYTGSYYKAGIPPLSASFEVGVKDGIIEKGSIGVGGYLGYSSHKWEYSGWGWKYSNIILGVRGNFHYPLMDKLDTYTGLMLGYNIASSKEFGTSTGYDYHSASGGIVYSWFVGGRYYFSDKFAAMLELGYGITYLNIGIALKL